ncbi:YdgA family protein [Alcaligenaceae bacterium CGII-47]|nr:YdgA family protein [Alcaligenaceae bacterium CGII-47]
MKSRFYIAFGVILALVLAYAGASWYAGKQAQDQIELALEQANLQLGAAWPVGQERPTLRVQAYQRGWFSSSIEYAFAYKDDAGHDQELRLHDDLQHGPFPWRGVRAGEFSPMLADSQVRLLPTEALQAWFDTQQGASPLQIDTQVSFSGVAHSMWQFHPAKFLREGEQFDFSGGQIDVVFNQRQRTSETRGAFDSLVWEDAANGERGEFKNITFEGRNAFVGEEDFQIHNQAQIGQITVTQPDQPTLTLADMQVKLDASRTGALLDSTLAYGFGGIHVDETDLGQLQAGARVEHIDMVAFRALMAAWEQVNPDDADDASLSLAAQALLQGKIKAVLAASPSVTIEPLKWKNSQGESQAMLAVHFMPASADAASDEDIGTLLERSLRQVHLKLNVSKAMLLQLIGQLDTGDDAERTRALLSMLFDHYTAGMQRAGLIEIRDGIANLDVSYQAGEVVLGDAKMSVEAFIKLIQSVMG